MAYTFLKSQGYEIGNSLVELDKLDLAKELLAYAKEFDKQTELKVRLQNAYFGERKDVSNREVLEEEVKAVGLNTQEAMKRLDDPKAVEAVEDEEKFWRDQGIYAIPTVIFNNQIAQVGASETKTYKEILTELSKKR